MYPRPHNVMVTVPIKIENARDKIRPKGTC